MTAVHLSRRAAAPGLAAAAPAVADFSWIARDTKGGATAGAALRRLRDLAATARGRLSEPVRCATLAANNHNAQAGRSSGDDALITLPPDLIPGLTPDLTCATPVVDPDNHPTCVSLETATETLVIATSAFGLDASTTFDAGDGSIAIALSPGAGVCSLLNAVNLRQSSQNTFARTPLGSPERVALAQTVTGSQVARHPIGDAPRKTASRDPVIAENAPQRDDPAFVGQLRDWLRFRESAAVTRAGGLFSGCSGNPSMPQRLGDTNAIRFARAGSASAFMTIKRNIPCH